MPTPTFTSPFDQTPHLASDETRARFLDSIAFLDPEKEEETRHVLIEHFDTGNILNGTESFAEGGERDSGMDNGMFSCFLAKKNAPQGKSRAYEGPFWSDIKRKWYAERAFVACTKASIPLVFEGDAPVLSPIADMMLFAAKKKVMYLGYIGKTSGRGPLLLDPVFTDNWNRCAVSDDQLHKTLNGGTFTIDNTEVKRIVQYPKGAYLPLLSRHPLSFRFESDFCGVAN